MNYKINRESALPAKQTQIDSLVVKVEFNIVNWGYKPNISKVEEQQSFCEYYIDRRSRLKLLIELSVNIPQWKNLHPWLQKAILTLLFLLSVKTGQLLLKLPPEQLWEMLSLLFSGS